MRRRPPISVNDFGTPSPHKESIYYEKKIGRFSICYGPILRGSEDRVNWNVPHHLPDGSGARSSSEHSVWTSTSRPKLHCL